MVIIDLMRKVGELAQGSTCDIAVRSAVDADLAERWCARTGNTIVRTDVDERGAGRVVVRRGRPPDPAAVIGADRLPGVRLWLYTNFHCNLSCDYCCVASSPQAPHRELGADRIARLVSEAADWGVRELYLTGGEPFLLPDIGRIIATCVDTLPTTVLTNAMVFKGRARRALESLPREGLALQISLDSAAPDLHDAHRGAGSWSRAVAGIRLALSLGFRVRVAATVAAPAAGELAAFHDFLDCLGIPRDDQIVRPIALEGVAQQGLSLHRESLVPEVTVTADGVYWHPVTATDQRALVTPTLEPLTPALDMISQLFAEQWARAAETTALFPCA